MHNARQNTTSRKQKKRPLKLCIGDLIHSNLFNKLMIITGRCNIKNWYYANGDKTIYAGNREDITKIC